MDSYYYTELTAEEARKLTAGTYSRLFSSERYNVMRDIRLGIRANNTYTETWVTRPMVVPIRKWLSSLGYSSEVDMDAELKDEPHYVKLWIYWWKDPVNV